MFLLVSISLDSSLKNPSYVYVESILLKWEDISYLIVYGIKSLEIWRENLSKIFLYFESLILEYFVSRIASLKTN